MTVDDADVERASDADWPEISRLFLDSFHSTPDPEAVQLDERLFQPDRSLLIRRGPTVVAHTGSFARELSVPGGSLPAAHVDLVAVAMDHRRQGLLTRLVHRQLAAAHKLGEPLAVLWASEGRIYQRFGYGMAVSRLMLDIDTRTVLLPPARPAPASPQAGWVQCSEPTEVTEQLRSTYERVRPVRPGWSSRDDLWWRYRVLADPPGRRRGATPWRAVVHQSTDGPDGYALWRVRQAWEHASADGTVEVRELVSASPAAHRMLWAFLVSIDLTRYVRYPLGAPDDPLIYLVDEPRRLGARLADALWLRIVDLPAALTARRYDSPVDVVLEVSDDILAANRGRWRLEADSSGASCRPSAAAADIICDIRDLAVVYLGEGALQPLVDAGRITECRPGAIVAAQRALGWRRRPSAVEMF
jgi:predicted acetyltransferase